MTSDCHTPLSALEWNDCEVDCEEWQGEERREERGSMFNITLIIKLGVYYNGELDITNTIMNCFKLM